MDHTDQFKLVLVTATDLIIKNHQLSVMLKPGMVQRIGQTAADRICLLHIRFHKYCAGRYLQRNLFAFYLCILKSFYDLIVYLLQFRFGYLLKLITNFAPESRYTYPFPFNRRNSSCAAQFRILSEKAAPYITLI